MKDTDMPAERHEVLAALRTELIRLGDANDVEDRGGREEAVRLRDAATAAIRDLVARHPFLLELFPTLVRQLDTGSLYASGWSALQDAVDRANLPRLYTDLAGWFHLLTAPDEYANEAAAYRDALLAATVKRPRTLLELGSGGGNNAFHLKRDFECTLTDLAPAMLAISRRLNPECEHVEGDMRLLRLGRQFDAVFVHDAVMYLTSEDDLRRAVETAFVHTRPGGVALFAPDYLMETFETRTDSGGRDGGGRGVRVFAGGRPPEPGSHAFEVDFVYLLREGSEPTRIVHDRHVCGLFSRATWLRLLNEAGFTVTSATRPRDDERSDEVFVGVRR
jgi:SAM-dependent methyltransferase